MSNKPKTVYFYRIESEDANNINCINAKFTETFNFFQHRQTNNVETINLSENDFYISAIDRAFVDDTNGENFAWEFCISKLDPHESVQIGNLDRDISERNHELQVEENEGPVKNSTFIYDPNTCVLAFYRKAGGTTKNLLKRFISRFCGVKAVDFEFTIIPDQDAIDSLDNLRDSSRLTYKIANVSNFESLENDARQELADIDQASNLGAEGMEISLYATSLNLGRIQDRARILFNHVDDLGVEKLEVEGDRNDGVIEPIDLIQHKLVYKGKLQYDHIITIRDSFDFIRVAYANKYEFLVRNFER